MSFTLQLIEVMKIGNYEFKLKNSNMPRSYINQIS